MNDTEKLEIAEALSGLSKAMVSLASLYTDPGIRDRVVVELSKINRQLLDSGERLKKLIDK
jgi:hypothetical protein